MNEREPRKSWEADLDDALKRLPERQAPDSLVPNVMAAIRLLAAAPWYQRSWWQWPVSMRAASVMLGVSLMAGLVWLAGLAPRVNVGAQLTTWTEMFTGLFATLEDALLAVMDAAITVPVTFSQIHYVLLIMAMLMMTMYLTCIGLGTVLYRFARRS